MKGGKVYFIVRWYQSVAGDKLLNQYSKHMLSVFLIGYLVTTIQCIRWTNISVVQWRLSDI